MSGRAPTLPEFDPAPHREALEGIVREVAERIAAGEFDGHALDGILRRHPRDGRGFFSRAEIIAGYRACSKTTRRAPSASLVRRSSRACSEGPCGPRAASRP